MRLIDTQAKRKIRSRRNYQQIADDFFAFVVSYKSENDGLSPCVKEIIRHCDIATCTYYTIEEMLIAQGRIRLCESGSGAVRGMMIVGGRWQAPTDK